jgi:DNA-binding CsgD family transcriptional regulator
VSQTLPVQAAELVGRKAELDAVDAFLQRVVLGLEALVIEGEPGIGKTTLWREALNRARGASLLVLSAGPVGAEAQLGFAALADLLEPVADGILPSLPEPQRRALAVALLREAPGRRRIDQRTISSASVSLLRVLASRGPIVVAVDDLQWLDRPSARVIEFAIRRLSGLPVGLLGCERLDEASRVPVDLGRALPEGRLKRLRLGPLSLASLHELLKERLGRSYARPSLVRIQQASDGNPFFALEIARALDPTEPVGPQAPLPVPKDVRTLVRRRIEGLSKPTRGALLRVAALSHPTAALLGPTLGPARRSGLIHEFADGRITFTHPLYASAVYEAATQEERRATHRELAKRVDDVEERARHLALATSDPDDQVAAELDHAAERARSRGAPEMAAELQERALDLTPIGDPRPAQHRALVAAEDWFHAGAPTRARSLLEETLAGLDDRALRARALRLLAQARLHEGSIPEAVELLRRAAEEAGEDPELRAPVERDLVFALVSVSFDFEEAQPHAEALISYAERLADKGLLAEALATATILEFLLGGGVDEERLARALALEDPEHRVAAEFRPTLIAGFLAFYTGRFDRARSLLYPLRAELHARGADADLPMICGHLSWLEAWAGAFEVARSFADEAIEAATLAESETMMALSLADGALVEAHAGRVEVCRDRAHAAEQAALRTGYGIASIWSSAALGLLELSFDNAEGAYRALEPWIEFVEQHGLGEPIRAFFIADGIETLIALGEVDRAERLTDMLATRGRQLDRAFALATSARCSALLSAARGNLDGALRQIERALDEHERLPMPLELGRTLFVKGRIERRARRKAAARLSLEHALEIFEEIGSPLWAVKARAELARVDPRRAASEELTETERRVAELAASGRTNRQAASQLFMSPKTVEANLARVYRKLGIRSRAELGARLAHVGSSRTQT